MGHEKIGASVSVNFPTAQSPNYIEHKGDAKLWVSDVSTNENHPSNLRPLQFPNLPNLMNPAGICANIRLPHWRLFLGGAAFVFVGRGLDGT